MATNIHEHSPRSPECVARTPESCTCAEYYGINADADMDRAIEISQRLDHRRQERVIGLGPETEEQQLDGDADTSVRQIKPGDHFWKRSEFLACNRGRTMYDVDMNRFQGQTWKRAQR